MPAVSVKDLLGLAGVLEGGEGADDEEGLGAEASDDGQPPPRPRPRANFSLSPSIDVLRHAEQRPMPPGAPRHAGMIDARLPPKSQGARQIVASVQSSLP